MSDLVRREHDVEREEHEGARIEIGQWYWYDGDLYCVTEIGSNYIEVSTQAIGWDGSSSVRIHNDDFNDECQYEPDPEPIISGRALAEQSKAAALMEEIRALSARLGIGHRDALSAAAGESQALAVASSTKNIKAHKQALIKAKEKTLPELFKQIEKCHERAARYLKMPLLAMQAKADLLKNSIESLNDRILMVELYAGLVEEVTRIREGEPAPLGTKISLHQRRHYMDEECLAAYEAGGIDLPRLADFDKWLARPENFERLLPFPRSVVAFRVRRDYKEREGITFADFIRICYEREGDMETFLYIRNGEQLYRLSTRIDFGEELFPDHEHVSFTGGRLWMEIPYGEVKRVLSNREYQGIVEDNAVERKRYKAAKRAWKKMTPKEREKRWHEQPHDRSTDLKRFAPCTPDSVYYDDAMKYIAREATRHNRIAIVLQGLLDRSPVFHPHPPWQLWTPEGFVTGIELFYDATRALTDGDPPDFEAYRARLNASLKKGCVTVGQRDAWGEHEAEKDYQTQLSSYRVRNPHRRKWHAPWGNPGPARVAEVVRFGKHGATFEWLRERQRHTWETRRKSDDIVARFTCPADRLLNVSAYRAGDFKQFFADPRTRRDYLQWAPLLLAAEDYVNSRQEED